MKVYTVERAGRSKQERRCRCGHVVQPGERYFHWHPRYGAQGIGCAEHYPRPSQLASNDKLATLYGAQEAAYDSLDAWDGQDVEDVRSLMEEAISGAEEAVELYDESISNVEEHFPGGSPVLDQLQEGRDAAEAWQGELETAKDDLEDFEEEDTRQEAERELGVPEEPDAVTEWMEEHYPDAEEFQRQVDAKVNERREEWAEEQRSKARDAIDALEV